MIRNYRPWYADPLFWGIFFIDMLTKQMAVAYCYKPIVFIKNILTFSLSFNRGISFAMFHSENPLVFYAVSLVVFLILCYLAKYTLDRQKEGKNILGELLVLAGGWANFTDRVHSNAVVDFIQLSYNNYYFPTFNIADIAITFGACIMFYSLLQGDDA